MRTNFLVKKTSDEIDTTDGIAYAVDVIDGLIHTLNRIASSVSSAEVRIVNGWFGGNLYVSRFGRNLDRCPRGIADGAIRSAAA